MSDNELLDLHRRHFDAQNKYVYFLLAVTASAVAFAVQKTDGMVLSWNMLLLALAVLSWGTSFYFGCSHLVWAQTVLRANYGLLQLKKGVHPEQPDHPEHLEAAMSGVNQALGSNIDKAEFYAVWQFRLLVLGVFFFLVWHIVEMWARTNAT